MNAQEHLELYENIFKLKKLKRFGWTKYDLKKSESVAEHSFGLAVLTLSIAPRLELDTTKVLKMALIHDLGESIIGDIQSPENKEDEKKKYDAENIAIEKVLSSISSDKDNLISMWEEFEEGRTPEAKFVKELDKIEMCLQALSYEKEQGKNLDEFFNHTESRLSIPELKEVFNHIKEKRP